MQTEQLLERLYRVRPRRRGPRWHHRIARSIRTRINGHATVLAVGSVVVAAWVLAHIFFYNQLINLDYNVQTSWAQVEASQIKRDHVRRSLARLLTYYAAHERTLMKDVTRMRTTEVEPPAQTPSPTQLLAELDAVAEQYPSLRLTETVQEATKTVVATETEITQRIQEYNQAVNVYTTARNQFPGMLFARVLGFPHRDYYMAEDAQTLQYREIDP